MTSGLDPLGYTMLYSHLESLKIIENREENDGQPLDLGIPDKLISGILGVNC